MPLLEASLVILLLATLAGPLAERIHLPVEVFLLVASCAMSFIPGIPEYRMDPQVVFQIFLPPILFSAAYFTSWRDFKKTRAPSRCSRWA